VQGWWSGDVFRLRTKLNASALKDLFLKEYQPTPVAAPWNGGSGFFPKDNKVAIKQIGEGSAVRLAPFRATLDSCHSIVAEEQLTERPADAAKEKMLMACRNRLPDEALVWLDAVYVLTSDGPRYPPLLGTGGNDGRLDFTNNLMQRLLDLIDPESGDPTSGSESWWHDAFFSRIQNDLQKTSILGQFDPGAVERPVNPWDYVLMIEGSLAFAAAATKRHEAATQGVLSYPFCVRSAGVGYGSAASDDESSSRAEIWLPLWSQPCSHREIAKLFSEGRAELHGRAARNGVDFAQSIATLGIDRGIKEFARLGFHARNGLAFFAVPLGRFQVTPQPQVNLLGEVDDWLQGFRRAAASENAPTRAKRALRQLEAAILDLCRDRGPQRLQRVLIALAAAEESLAIAPKWREESFQRPVPLLSSHWLTDCDDESPEFRLAASLAGIYSIAVGDMRQHLEPVDASGKWPAWNEDSSARNNVVWTHGALDDNLLAVLHRRAILAVQRNERSADDVLVFPGVSTVYANLSDVSEFLQWQVDDLRIAALLRGLCLIKWSDVPRDTQLSQPGGDDRLPDATFSLLKLCHSPHKIREQRVPLEPEIARLMASGRPSQAIRVASRRLTGSGLPPTFRVAARSGASTRRIAAALLFPLSPAATLRLARTVLKPEPETQTR
jgi:CRISPR-associated protein Csx17